MEAVEGAPGGVGETPRLASVEEDGGDNGLVEHPGDLERDALLCDDFGDPPSHLTRALGVTPDGWRTAVVPRDDPSQVLEDFHRAEGVLLVGGELAFNRRRHLRRQLLLPPPGRKFPAFGRLLVPHSAGGPGLQSVQAALGGASPSNPHRTVPCGWRWAKWDQRLASLLAPLPSRPCGQSGTGHSHLPVAGMNRAL